MKLGEGAVTLYREGSAGRYFQFAAAFAATSLVAAWTMLAFSDKDTHAKQVGILSAGVGFVVVGTLMARVARLFQRGDEPAPCADVEIERGVVRAMSEGRDVRSEVVAGWFEETAGATGPAVELALASGDSLLVRVASEDEGVALLATLGLDPRRRAVAFPLEPAAAHGWRRTTLFAMTTTGAIVLGAALLGALGHAAALALLALALVLAGWGMARLGSGTAVVGSEGIALRGATRRFVPYAHVLEVVREPRATTLRLRRGRPIRLVTPERSSAETTLGDALSARILGAMAKGSIVPDPAVERLERLDPNGRSFDAWLRDARAALAREPGYRDAGFTREDLAGLLEDPAAPLERRLAAAVALGADGEPSFRPRVEAAAGACASDALRHALAKAYAGELDEETLEHARASLGS